MARLWPAHQPHLMLPDLIQDGQNKHLPTGGMRLTKPLWHWRKIMPNRWHLSVALACQVRCMAWLLWTKMTMCFVLRFYGMTHAMLLRHKNLMMFFRIIGKLAVMRLCPASPHQRPYGWQGMNPICLPKWQQSCCPRIIFAFSCRAKRFPICPTAQAPYGLMLPHAHGHQNC